MRSCCLAQLCIQGVLLGGNANDHQFQISSPVIDERVCFVEANRHGVTFMNWSGFAIDLNLTISVEHVIDLFDTLMPMQSI